MFALAQELELRHDPRATEPKARQRGQRDDARDVRGSRLCEHERDLEADLREAEQADRREQAPAEPGLDETTDARIVLFAIDDERVLRVAEPQAERQLEVLGHPRPLDAEQPVRVEGDAEALDREVLALADLCRLLRRGRDREQRGRERCERERDALRDGEHGAGAYSKPAGIAR